MAKATTTAKADKTKDQAPEMAPEETKAPEETEDGTQKEEKAKATTTAKAEKVYKFTSKNKYLTCSAVGVQFIDGKAETKSLEAAKVLATLDGVTLIEE